ncbi:p53 apoptosis effector related to PMP-22 [Frankliniella fusca]|uniref:P53 apoptosis effector related to PMP-22 n=1 Tax=Frankliniella fusca TaxID=407009 RepID=A0AAE1H643_9NEOP|nr:p53 apoptosis effector related to PMP-22 [Frankliniella fusca]
MLALSRAYEHCASYGCHPLKYTSTRKRCNKIQNEQAGIDWSSSVVRKECEFSHTICMLTFFINIVMQ